MAIVVRENSGYIERMIGDIRKHLEGQTFVPFTVNMADGRRVYVPSRDPIAFVQTRAIVLHDDESWDILHGLLMSGLTINQPASETN